jgi:hypothetical protein
MLVLYGTHGAHDERMKSAVSAERAYWTDGRQRFMIVFDECGSLADLLSGSSHGRFGCGTQSARLLPVP